MTRSAMTPDAVSNEALFILKNLRENGRLGRSNKLADVKSAMEPSVSIEFDSYFFFLRKFHYIAMDREAQLKLTDTGERVVDGEYVDQFNSDVSEFFADQLGWQEEHTQAAIDISVLAAAATAPPPPPPSEDVEISAPPPPPPAAPMSSTSRSRKAVPALEEPLVPPISPQIPPLDSKRERDYAPVPGAVTAPSVASVAGARGAAGPQDGDLRYVKFDPVGSGPLGTVFKGRHNPLGLDVCVKELKDIFGYFSFLQRGEVIKRLKKELCAQAAVRHPSVVAVLDQNTDVARPFFVMELCRGSLREKLDQAGGKGIDVPSAVRYFLQLCYGLRAAHASGLTHHNIKPENVLFDAMGNVKVGDFGLGRVIEVDQAKGMPQVFVGTGGMGYMAPELLARTKDAGASADVYGLGILLYEMLTGQLPGRRSPLPSEANAEVPSKLDPVFDKMTQDRKEARYPDFDAALDDFYGAFSDSEYLHKGDLILWSEPR